MDYPIIQEQQFKYGEQGEGEVIVLLHGLFGALSNFTALIEHFSPRYKILIPLLPIFDLKKENTSVTALVDYVESFLVFKQVPAVHLVGNSLGGHVAQLLALRHPEWVKTLTLTGSSGLFENSLGETYPRRGNYEFVQKKTEETFYDPKMATKALVDEVFEIVNNREKVIRMVMMAKSALRQNLKESVTAITQPVCLIWGKEDRITPPFVGEEFQKLLPNAELHLLEHCGHAPMMELPKKFNAILEHFLTNKNK